MKIYIHKEWQDIQTGLTYYPGEHNVQEETAIKAAIEGVTDSPEAHALAETSGAKADAEKALSSLKKVELLAEIKRLRKGDPDTALQDEVAHLTAQNAKLGQDLEAVRAEFTVLNEDAQLVLMAHNENAGETGAAVKTLGELATLISTVSNDTEQNPDLLSKAKG